MKKVIVSTTLAAGLFISGVPAFAQGDVLLNGTENPVTVVKEEVVDASKFMKVHGKIVEVEKEGDSIKLFIKDPTNSSEAYLTITEETLAYNSATTETAQEFEKGAFIEAYYDKNKPMILIYPAQITPEIVVVHDKEEMGNVKVGKFDKDLLSLDKEIKLFLDKDTVLLNQQGEAIKESELPGKELIVFYTISTKSLPAQTTPTKIIALDQTEVESIIFEDHFYQDGVKMIPLRKVAESLGFEVEWKSGTVRVEKPEQLIYLKISNEMYTVNKADHLFAAEPTLRDGKTYVSEDMLYVLGAE